MSAPRHLAIIAVAIAPLLGLAACNGGGGQPEEFVWQPVFGDNARDVSPVIARVAGVEITEDDLMLRYDELPPKLQRRYKGEEGLRLLLRNMVDQVWLVRGAIDLELYNDQDVARTLISERRATLERAMRYYGLFRDAEPTEEQLQDFFMDHRDQYQMLGRVLARHVETTNRADADRAYERLLSEGRTNKFPYVVKDLSVNEGTKEQEGNLGWFNRGGFIPHVRDAQALSNAIYDLPEGVNPPVQVGDRWHVVEIQKRDPERPMTYHEARDRVEQDYLPVFQDELVEQYLEEARAKYPVEYSGEYAPGAGVTDEELFQRALLIPDPERQIEVLELLVDDFPESERVDDALFLLANATMDRWADRRRATLYLTRLVEQHPESEYVEDALYLLENIDDPKAWAPESIEDLQR